MSVIKMGPIITQIKGMTEKLSRRRRALNFLLFQVSKIAWLLWGRRRAFAKMQRLALGDPQVYSNEFHTTSAVGVLESEKKRIKGHRILLDSIEVKERLPPPDVDDSGLN